MRLPVQLQRAMAAEAEAAREARAKVIDLILSVGFKGDLDKSFGLKGDLDIVTSF